VLVSVGGSVVDGVVDAIGAMVVEVVVSVADVVVSVVDVVVSVLLEDSTWSNGATSSSCSWDADSREVVELPKTSSRKRKADKSRNVRPWFRSMMEHPEKLLFVKASAKHSRSSVPLKQRHLGSSGHKKPSYRK